MWRPEVSGGGVALLRVPIAAFGDGSRAGAASRYRPLPRPAATTDFPQPLRRRPCPLRRRRWQRAGTGARWSVAPVRGGPVAELALGHAVDRIEALGRDALVVGDGADESLGFTAVELAPRRPRLGDVYACPPRRRARRAATPSSSAPTTPDGASGLLGLPVARAVEPAYRALLRQRRGDAVPAPRRPRFAPAGELAAESRGVVDDACEASCIDWYGNARPIFLGDRSSPCSATSWSRAGWRAADPRDRPGQFRARARAAAPTSLKSDDSHVL